MTPWTIDHDARGLEIGPLHNPRLPKGEYNVLYVDHLPTGQLAEKYRDDPNVGEVLHVDIVWSGDRPIADVVGGERFDYVLASHVIEHIPDPIGWLNELQTVLNPGGFIALVIPDKRYCFDIRRRESGIWDLVEAYLRQAKVARLGQIYEFTSLMVAVDTAAVWRGESGYPPGDRTDLGDVDEYCLRLCRDQLGNGHYVDVHCWTFTPPSFVEVYQRLVRLGLVHLGIEMIEPTQVNGLEFYVTLRAGAVGQSTDWLIEMGEAARQAAASGPEPPVATDGSAFQLEPALTELCARVDELGASLARVEAHTSRIIGFLGRARHPLRTASSFTRSIRRYAPRASG